MTDRDNLRMRFRIANPVPDEDAIDTDELDRILMAIEAEWDVRRGLALPSNTPNRSRRLPAVVFAAALLLLLLAVGLPMLLLGGEDLAPVEEATTVPTTTATTVSSTTVPVTVPPEPTTTTPASQAVSAPAMTWERVPHQPIFDDATIFRVVEAGPGLVAVGALGEWNSFEEIPRVAVFVSSDGYEWERIDSPAFESEGYAMIGDVAVGPDGLLVALGDHGDEGDVFYLSTDGLTWERVAREGPGGLVSTETGFIGFGGLPSVGGTRTDAAMWSSTDGREWTRIEDEAFLATEDDEWSVSIDSVTEGGPGFVAIGSVGRSQTNAVGLPGFDRTAVWVSADGTDWERLRDLEDEYSGSISSDPDGDRLIKFGVHMWTSTDGYTWTKMEKQDPMVQPRGPARLVWDGDRVVAGSADVPLSLWVSGDRGATWSRIDPNDPVFDGYRPMTTDVTRFGDLFVAVGAAGDYGAEVAAVWIGRWDD